MDYRLPDKRPRIPWRCWAPAAVPSHPHPTPSANSVTHSVTHWSYPNLSQPWRWVSSSKSNYKWPYPWWRSPNHTPSAPPDCPPAPPWAPRKCPDSAQSPSGPCRSSPGSRRPVGTDPGRLPPGRSAFCSWRWLGGRRASGSAVRAGWARRSAGPVAGPMRTRGHDGWGPPRSGPRRLSRWGWWDSSAAARECPGLTRRTAAVVTTGWDFVERGGAAALWSDKSNVLTSLKRRKWDSGKIDNLSTVEVEKLKMKQLYQSTNQPINRWINQAIKQSTEKSINQSINRHVPSSHNSTTAYQCITSRFFVKYLGFTVVLDQKNRPAYNRNL